jgi:hypothetical protein
MEKEFRKILAEISGYTEQELTDRHTEPLIQPYDCLLAMSQALIIADVVVPKGTLCDVCGSDDVIEAPSMGRNCNRCNPL